MASQRIPLESKIQFDTRRNYNHDIDGRPRIDSDYDPLLERLRKTHDMTAIGIKAEWKGDRLYLGRKLTGYEVVADQTYPQMWRVRSPDGSLSDMVNRTRAKDAALAMLGRIVNKTGRVGSTDGI